MSLRRRSICTSVAALLGGIALYLLFREKNHFSGLFWNNTVLQYLRGVFAPLSCNFLRYYLPDYLWCLSLNYSLIAIFTPAKSVLFLCSATAVCSGIIWELLQYTHVISGTGDWLDVMMYLLAGITVFWNTREKENMV